MKSLWIVLLALVVACAPTHSYGTDYRTGIPAPASPTEGQILVYHSGAWSTLSQGTSGQALTSQGAASLPTWAAAGVWQTALDCDFTAQTTQNLTDGTYTFCGQTWTKINSSFDHSTAHITNGTGLVFAPADNTTGSLWTNHTMTALTVPLTSILSSVDPATPLRIWLYVAAQTQAPSGGEEGVHVGVDDWNGTVYTWTWNETIGVTGSGNGLALRQSSSTCSTHESDDISSQPTPPYVVTMTLQDGVGGRRAQQWRNGTYSSGFPLLSGMVPAQNEDRGQLTFASGCITNYVAPSSEKLILGAVGNVGWSGYDNYGVTIGRIRVDYHL